MHPELSSILSQSLGFCKLFLFFQTIPVELAACYVTTKTPKVHQEKSVLLFFVIPCPPEADSGAAGGFVRFVVVRALLGIYAGITALLIFFQLRGICF